MFRNLTILLLISLLTACGNVLPARPTHDPAVPKTITATDNTSGLIRIAYPGDWLADAPGDATISVGNSGLAIRNYRDDITELESGQVVGTVSALAKSALPNNIDDNVLSVLRYITGLISAPTEGQARYTFGSLQERTMDGRAAALSDGLGTGNDIALDLRVVVIDAGAAYGVIFIGAPFDELQAYWPQIDSIAQSFAFFIPEEVRATQTAVAAPD